MNSKQLIDRRRAYTTTGRDGSDAKTAAPAAASAPACAAAPLVTRWFAAGNAPAREGWYEVMCVDGKRMMADWRRIGSESAFWIYAEFGAMPMRKKISNVRKWRGMLAGEDPAADG